MTLPAPRRSRLFLSLALALLPALAAAADGPVEVASDQTDPRHDEPKTLQAVQVKATPLPDTADSLAVPVEVLAGERLDAAKASSLGETVDRLPGVQSSYFGPGVGRPIVRGKDGACVQVLSDGLGSGDVSTVSADHAVTIEPFLADQIEVLKGPATLLYGSGAIGGAVNVIDGRIPETLPVEPLQGRAELRAGTVNDGAAGMLRLDGAAGDVALHFDALHRETGDFDTPEGPIENSALRTDSAALGVSWIGERGFLGAGYSLYSTRYGVPGHEHGDEEHEEDGHDLDDGHDHAAHEGVRVVMDQRRNEVRGGIDRLGVFESLRVKLATTSYTHTELEDGAVGTVFENDSREGRLELVHQPLAGFDGAVGLQWSERDFGAVGAEAFVPGSQSRDLGAFWIGKRHFGPFGLQLGLRHDRNRIDVDDAVAIGPDRRFDTTSGSLSLEWEASEDLHLALGFDRAQRSPTAEELYSNGVHVATGSVEHGDPALDVETANRTELGAHWHLGPLTLRASVYRVAYDDFIYLAHTGTFDDELPVQQWRQADARFTGGEAELDWALTDNASGHWDLRLFGYLVRAKLADGGNLPRIAPARVGAELRWERDALRASLGAVRYMEQDRVAAFETATPGYTLVDAHVAWHADTRGGNAWEVFLDGRNLLDSEARPHTSFLKDLVPLPGRGIEAGIRVFF